MSEIPITRYSMRTFHEQILEEERKLKINSIVSQIYHSAVHTAQRSTYTNYFYEFSEYHPDAEFYRINMPEIVAKVQSLFPDCSVTHRITNDISEMDELHKQYIMNQIRTSEYIEYIIIDWS